MNAQIDLPAHPRILVIALRRLGDVLLTTPLIRSLRRAWPLAKIDILVFSDTAAILDGNPDLDDVLEAPPRASAAQSLSLAWRLWRSYDLAITTQAGDRPTFLAVVAGRKRAGPVEHRLIGWVKQALLNRYVPTSRDVHRVDDVLALARVLGIAPVAEVVCPRAARPDALPNGPYAVIHAAPMFRYKQWHADGWRAAAAHLARRGIAVVATGGPGEAEHRYLDEIWQGAQGADVLRLDGKLSWPELAAALARARVYLGPDTSVTHLAAAAGCPTVALYGPTDPRLWGPWPASGLAQPWQAAGTVQQRGNVWLVQNPLPCQPCQHEGCLRDLQSYSRCLDELPQAAVTAALDAALTRGRDSEN